LHTHGFAGNHIHDGGVTRLQVLGVLFQFLARSSVDLFLQFCELAGNVGGVAIQHWRIPLADLARVVQDNDLGSEAPGLHGGVVLAVTSHVPSSDILHRHVLYVEANVVTRESLHQSLVVHLHRLHFSGDVTGGKGDHHASLDDTSFHSAHGHCANTSYLVDILQGQTQRLVGGAGRGDDRVQSFQQGNSTGISLLTVNLPALEPGHVGAGLQHVVSVPARDWHEGHGGGVVADFLDVGADFLGDFLVSLLAVGGLGGVHLVDANDELFHPQGVGQEGMLTGLAVLGDAGFKLSHATSHDQHSTVSLGGASDHVLDEIPVPGGIDDGDVVLGSLEFPEGDVDGDATLPFCLQLVQHPGVLKGSFAHLGRLLLELLDGPLVDAPALVDQVAGGRGLAGVHMADDHDVDVGLFLSHCGGGGGRCWGLPGRAASL
uniref:Uncharacterized protein n=1 Tax=Ailuropoda melanoleuca TaxID=9646 RepID=G1LAS7_AILME